MRNYFLKFTMFCLLLLGAVSIQSCSDDDEKDDVLNDDKVAVFLMSQVNDWRKAVKYYAEKALDEQGLSYTMQIANDTESQMTQLRDAANAGYKVMVVCPEGVNTSNEKEYGELIDELASKGIKIILSETAIGNNYTSIIYYDNENIGKQAAEAVHIIFDDLSATSPTSYLFNITGEMSLSDHRNQGYSNKMQTWLNNFSSSKFDVSSFTRDSGKEGTEKIENHIKSSLSQTAVIYAQDDEIALGVLEYISEKEDEETLFDDIYAIIGCGGSQEFLQKIKQQSEDGPILATTLYAPKTLMNNCFEIAAKVLKGESIQKDNLLTSDIVTKANVDQYIDDKSPY